MGSVFLSLSRIPSQVWREMKYAAGVKFLFCEYHSRVFHLSCLQAWDAGADDREAAEAGAEAARAAAEAMQAERDAAQREAQVTESARVRSYFVSEEVQRTC